MWQTQVRGSECDSERDGGTVDPGESGRARVPARLKALLEGPRQNETLAEGSGVLWRPQRLPREALPMLVEELVRTKDWPHHSGCPAEVGVGER